MWDNDDSYLICEIFWIFLDPTGSLVMKCNTRNEFPLVDLFYITDVSEVKNNVTGYETRQWCNHWDGRQGNGGAAAVVCTSRGERCRKGTLQYWLKYQIRMWEWETPVRRCGRPVSPVCPGPVPEMRVSDKWIFYVSPSPAAAAGHWTDGRFKQRAVWQWSHSTQTGLHHTS